MKKYKLKQWYPSLHNDWVVGDIVIPWGKQKDYYHIPNKSTTIFKREVENNPDFWELIEEEKPLFITEDKVEMFEGDKFIIVTDNFIKHKAVACNNLHREYKAFKYESNADEYILHNKPLLSLVDIYETIEMYSPEINELIKLAKERVETENEINFNIRNIYEKLFEQQHGSY